jgi:hypothetical protein
MTSNELAAIKARANAATPGPWFGHGDAVARAVQDASGDAEMEQVAQFGCIEDANFAAHAREDVPALLREVERLQAFVAEVGAGDHSQMCPLDHPAYRHKWCHCCEAIKVLNPSSGEAAEVKE